jgi:ubiquitin-protein ligase
MKLCELEVMLACNQRPISNGLLKVTNSWDLNKYQYIESDICDDNQQPAHRNQVKEIEYKHKFMNLDKIEQFANSPVQTSATKRLLQELNKLSKNKHPNIDVYILNDRLDKWHIVIQGEDTTIYAGGCWLVSCNFPENYPINPPEIRFITPIKHCNINSYGRVCHSILDNEYTSDMSIKTIFDCIYGLLLQPDTNDPLDSVLALSFFQASGEYETQIMNHTKKYANNTKTEWKSILETNTKEVNTINTVKSTSARGRPKK